MSAPVDRPEVDRAAAFAAGPARIPPKVLWGVLACVVVLGLGGVVVDHFVGVPSPSSATATTTAGAYPPPLTGEPDAGSAAPAPTGALAASQAAMMGLQQLRPAAAPAFALPDQHGALISTAGLRGKVVVLSFFDATCDDICPVLEQELAGAEEALGPAATDVVFVTLDSDPLALTPASAAPALAGPLRSSPSWHFLTGSLGQLDALWSAYGVTVDVQRSTGQVSHNDVLDFIDPQGRLRLRATPFADEAADGAFSLAGTVEASWSAGIAHEVQALIGGSR